MNSIRPILQALEESHGHLNGALFSGSLRTQPVITIQTNGRKSVLGWYDCGRWKNHESAPAELNVVAESLTRAPAEILETLLHEMVHQLASESGVKDCSRNGRYHNRKFKSLAESHGLMCADKDKALGFGITHLADSGKLAVESILSKVSAALTVSRIPRLSMPSKNKMKLYECSCGFKIRCGKDSLEATCNLCNSKFEIQE